MFFKKQAEDAAKETEILQEGQQQTEEVGAEEEKANESPRAEAARFGGGAMPSAPLRKPKTIGEAARYARELMNR